ncbi:MAG: hypothetical protein DYG89_32195 [Caldilinea sp. CFX5]|nr:hypothetical protein [Caldilinea sp. CFX5]
MGKQQRATTIPPAEKGRARGQANPQSLPLPTPTLAWGHLADPEMLSRLLLAQLAGKQQRPRRGIRPLPAAFQLKAAQPTKGNDIVAPEQREKVAADQHEEAEQQWVIHRRHLDYEQTHPAQHNFASRFRDR